MNTASKAGRTALFGAVGAAALLPAAAGWLMHRESRLAFAGDRDRTDAAAPLVPGERQYVPLEFAAAVVAGPNEGLALEGTLFLKELATGRLEGILLQSDDTLVPVTGQYVAAEDGKQTVRLLAHLSDRAVLDMSGAADFTLLPGGEETLHETLPRVRLVGFGFISGPTADDQGVWSFEAEGSCARAVVAAPVTVGTWVGNWMLRGDSELRAVDELLSD
jgi:hypothetical protein